MHENRSVTAQSRYRVYLKACLRLAIAVVVIVGLSTGVEAAETTARLLDLCHGFNALNTAIRDSRINKAVAKEQFRRLITEIKSEYSALNENAYSLNDWVFPLKGYGYKSIGGVKGNGYQKGGYDYFDGNKHTGHPSQDIFIKDKNRSCLDQLTNKPVTVLSLTGGVVVAVEKSWEPSSLLRGGKYIWIYDPKNNALIYYAHNSKLLVAVGDCVKPGGAIAEVGRTGLNAYKHRSPSHLHLTYLSIVDGLPKPGNIYQELLHSRLM